MLGDKPSLAGEVQQADLVNEITERFSLACLRPVAGFVAEAAVLGRWSQIEVTEQDDGLSLLTQQVVKLLKLTDPGRA